jgi:hypothetical protein
LFRQHLLGFKDARQKEAAHFQRQQRDFERLIRGPAAERSAFVAGYIYDLSPSTDDRPFFFDYFRLSHFLNYWRRDGGATSPYHPEFPVGHSVLLSSLLLIVALAVTLILLPLWRLRRHGTPTPLCFRTFAYFGALGLGFMFIEIGLMQKLILFLGHPTYSLSVVLSGMLVAAGLGALWSSRLLPSARLYRRLLVLLLVLIVGVALALNFALTPLLGLGFPLRVAISLVFITPAGFVLGIFFPLGIRTLEANAPALIPWGWAINGFLSVFASLLAIVLAMQVGFTGVLLLAAAVYAAGLLLAPAGESRNRPDSALPLNAAGPERGGPRRSGSR